MSYLQIIFEATCYLLWWVFFCPTFSPLSLHTLHLSSVIFFLLSPCLSAHLIFHLVFETDSITVMTEGKWVKWRSEGPFSCWGMDTKVKKVSPFSSWGWPDWDSNPISVRLHIESCLLLCYVEFLLQTQNSDLWAQCWVWEEPKVAWMRSGEHGGWGKVGIWFFTRTVALCKAL